MIDLEEQFRAWAGDLASRVPPYEWPGYGWRPTRSRRRLAVAAAVVVLAATIAVGSALIADSDPKQLRISPGPVESTIAPSIEPEPSTTTSPDSTTTVPATVASAGSAIEIPPETDFRAINGFSARTSADGLYVVIAFAGLAPPVANNTCTASYRAEVAETETEVWFRVYEQRQAGAPTCNPANVSRRLSLDLDQPLGNRTVIDALSRTQVTVFDGTRLAEPGWLPDGWTLQAERYLGVGGEDQSWFRSWAPAGAADQTWCIGLTQRPLAGAEPFVPDYGVLVAGGTVDVHGSTAEVGVDLAGQRQQMVWYEQGQNFDVVVSEGCGATVTSEMLVEFARGLVVPDGGDGAPEAEPPFIGARTSVTDSDIVLSFAGASWTSAGVFCAADYQATVRETDSEVSLTVEQTRDLETDQVEPCVPVYRTRNITVSLGSPLGDRTLIDARTGRPIAVIDGSTLTRPAEPYASWNVIEEGPADPSGGWSQTLSPGRPIPPVALDGCTVDGIEISFTQAPLPLPPGPSAPGTTVDVNGVAGTYHESLDDLSYTVLRWVEGDRGYVLSSQGCGVEPASKEMLLDFAHNLTIPEA